MHIKRMNFSAVLIRWWSAGRTALNVKYKDAQTPEPTSPANRYVDALWFNRVNANRGKSAVVCKITSSRRVFLSPYSMGKVL